MSELFIIGVIHQDREGPVHLRRWLERIRPGVLTVEVTKYGLAFRRKLIREREERDHNCNVSGCQLQSGLFPNEDSFFAIPFEYEVAAQYCEKNGGRLYPIDMDIFSYIHLRKIIQLPQAHQAKSEGQGHDKIETGRNEKYLARLFFEKGVKTTPYSTEMYIRDEYMARKLSTLMKYHPDKRFLHITGWRHLEDPCHLFETMEPIKVFIYDEASGF